MLVSIVTAPFRASARPDTLAPVVNEMLVSARMFPVNAVFVPRVAELPTCQNTLHGGPPLIMTDRRVARGRQRAPDLEHEDGAGVAPASSVRVPVSCAADEKQ